MAARLKAIQTGESAEAAMAELPVPHTDFGHELDKAVGSFCRRCRIYNCVTHSGPHVRCVCSPCFPAACELWLQEAASLLAQ